MTGIGRGKSRRGGKSRGCSNIGVLYDNSSATSSFRPYAQTQPSPDMGQSSNPHQVQSMNSLSSRDFVESVHPTPETENSGAGSGSRDIVNYCGLIMRSTISFRDGDWKAIIAKHGEAMWLKVKATSERNKLNRGKQITKHSCGSKSFAEVEESMRDPISGNKAAPDRVWELQHTRTDDKGEIVWSDPQSQQTQGQINEIVTQQQSEENEQPMSADEILATVLDERTGYVRGKGYGKKPTKKSNLQQVGSEASMFSQMERMRQEMQEEMGRKLQEEH